MLKHFSDKPTVPETNSLLWKLAILKRNIIIFQTSLHGFNHPSMASDQGPPEPTSCALVTWLSPFPRLQWSTNKP